MKWIINYAKVNKQRIIILADRPPFNHFSPNELLFSGILYIKTLWRGGKTLSSPLFLVDFSLFG
jgi:hypothetical protein